MKAVGHVAALHQISLEVQHVELTSLVLWGYQQGSDVSDACSRQEHEICSQRKKKSPLCHWLSAVCLSKLHHLGVAFFLSDFCLVWFGVVLL